VPQSSMTGSVCQQSSGNPTSHEQTHEKLNFKTKPKTQTLRGSMPPAATYNASFPICDPGKQRFNLHRRFQHSNVQQTHGNSHAIRAQVTQPEDAGAIRDNNYFHVIVRPVVHHGAHVPTILGGKVHATSTTEIADDTVHDRTKVKRGHTKSQPTHFPNCLQISPTVGVYTQGAESKTKLHNTLKSRKHSMQAGTNPGRRCSRSTYDRTTFRYDLAALVAPHHAQCLFYSFLAGSSASGIVPMVKIGRTCLEVTSPNENRSRYLHCQGTWGNKPANTKTISLCHLKSRTFIGLWVLHLGREQVSCCQPAAKRAIMATQTTRSCVQCLNHDVMSILASMGHNPVRRH
jgi:hypothetical protein